MSCVCALMTVLVKVMTVSSNKARISMRLLYCSQRLFSVGTKKSDSNINLCVLAKLLVLRVKGSLGNYFRWRDTVFTQYQQNGKTRANRMR